MHHVSEEQLDHENLEKYQSLHAGANFLAFDRIHLQFGAKECCTSKSRPTVRDSKLKRTGRFVSGCPRLVHEYKFQDEQGMLAAYNNANWASNASDRRSTSGGVFVHGSRCIKSWSKAQTLIALLSDESELCASVMASADAVGFQSVFRDPGQSWSTVSSDASAAVGVIQRQGSGRLRHVDCSFLFVQSLNTPERWCRKRRYLRVTIQRMSAPDSTSNS